MTIPVLVNRDLSTICNTFGLLVTLSLGSSLAHAQSGKTVVIEGEEPSPARTANTERSREWANTKLAELKTEGKDAFLVCGHAKGLRLREGRLRPRAVPGVLGELCFAATDYLGSIWVGQLGSDEVALHVAYVTETDEEAKAFKRRIEAEQAERLRRLAAEKRAAREEYQRKRTEEARRKEKLREARLTEKYGRFASSIMKGVPEIGMTPVMVKEAMGEPEDRDFTQYAHGTVEHWWYLDHQLMIRFDDGIVSAIHIDQK